MFLSLGLEDWDFSSAEETEHGGEGVSVSIDKDSVLVHGQAVSPGEHGCQRGVFYLAKSGPTRRDQVSSPNVQIYDVARLLEKLVNFLFVLLPSLLVSLKLFVLMLAFLGKLGFLGADHFSFALELVSLGSEQVLESEHELLEKSIDRRAFS